MSKGRLLLSDSGELVEPMIIADTVGDCRRWTIARTGQTAWIEPGPLLGGDIEHPAGSDKKAELDRPSLRDRLRGEAMRLAAVLAVRIRPRLR